MECLSHDIVFELCLSLDGRSICDLSQSCREINRAITQETLWCAKVREEFGECVRYKPEEITYRQQYIDLHEASSPVSDERPDLVLLFVKRGWWIPISLSTSIFWLTERSSLL